MASKNGVFKARIKTQTHWVLVRIRIKDMIKAARYKWYDAAHILNSITPGSIVLEKCKQAQEVLETGGFKTRLVYHGPD